MNKKFSQNVLTAFFFTLLVASVFILISIPFLNDYDPNLDLQEEKTIKIGRK
jgi:hypothetical protein